MLNLYIVRVLLRTCGVVSDVRSCTVAAELGINAGGNDELQPRALKLCLQLMVQKAFLGSGVVGVFVANLLHESGLIAQRLEMGAHQLVKPTIERHGVVTREKGQHRCDEI